MPTKQRLFESEWQGCVDLNTGLFSARFFKSIIAKQIQSFERYKTSFSIVLVSMPKEIFEQKSFDLREIALLVRSNVRLVDEIGSSGDGRFSILLPHTTLPGAESVAARLKSRLTERLGSESGQKVQIKALSVPENLDDIKKLFAA